MAAKRRSEWAVRSVAEKLWRCFVTGSYSAALKNHYGTSYQVAVMVGLIYCWLQYRLRQAASSRPAGGAGAAPLQIHVNLMQELLMPESERVRSWRQHLTRL